MLVKVKSTKIAEGVRGLRALCDDLIDLYNESGLSKEESVDKTKEVFVAITSILDNNEHLVSERFDLTVQLLHDPSLTLEQAYKDLHTIREKVIEDFNYEEFTTTVTLSVEDTDKLRNAYYLIDEGKGMSNLLSTHLNKLDWVLENELEATQYVIAVSIRELSDSLDAQPVNVSLYGFSELLKVERTYYLRKIFRVISNNPEKEISDVTIDYFSGSSDTLREKSKIEIRLSRHGYNYRDNDGKNEVSMIGAYHDYTLDYISVKMTVYFEDGTSESMIYDPRRYEKAAFYRTKDSIKRLYSIEEENGTRYSQDIGYLIRTAKVDESFILWEEDVRGDDTYYTRLLETDYEGEIISYDDTLLELVKSLSSKNVKAIMRRIENHRRRVNAIVEGHVENSRLVDEAVENIKTLIESNKDVIIQRTLEKVGVETVEDFRKKDGEVIFDCGWLNWDFGRSNFYNQAHVDKLRYEHMREHGGNVIAKESSLYKSLKIPTVMPFVQSTTLKSIEGDVIREMVNEVYPEYGVNFRVHLD